MLASSEAIAAFTQWTDLYTKFGIEKQIDFYNRFRTGTAPLGISSYTTYTQLTQAAPEIQGRWKICEIPGVMQEDGTIKEHFGKELPIIIHGLEYAWFDLEATEKANPNGQADTFLEAMKELGFC